MVLQSFFPGSVEVGENKLNNLCISTLRSYGVKGLSHPKTFSAQVLGIDSLGGDVQSCKLCGHSENILNMVLCDCCEEAFHVSCCNPKVVFPIDQWFCDSCLKVSLNKTCSAQVSGTDSHRGDIQSCKLCGNSENILNMILCDRCEEAVHISCCKTRVVFPIDKWFCDSCLKVSLPKTCSAQALGIHSLGRDLQSCKLCGHSENILKMLLCDCCEEAFHVSCCNPRVVLPIDEWFCHSCLKDNCKMSQNNSLLKSPGISWGIGLCKFEWGSIAVMLKYPKPYTSKVRIGEAFQAEVPDWVLPSEVHTDDWDCSSAVLLDASRSDCADPQLGSGTTITCKKRKREFPS